MLTYREITIPEKKSGVAEGVLRRLPAWFGIEDALLAYVEEVKEMYFLCAFANEMPVGFLAIHEHFESACEIHVMGILKEYHRQGIGRALVQRAAERYGQKGFSYMTVKTVAAPEGGAAYAATRAFYLAAGFLPLEVFPTLWDAHNPCLLLCKSLHTI